MNPRRNTPTAVATALVTTFVAVAVVCSPASASPGRSNVAWSVTALAAPTSFQTADNAYSKHIDRYKINVENIGSRASAGVLTVTDTLPAGISTAGAAKGGEVWSCTPEEPGAHVVTCTTENTVPALSPAGVPNQTSGVISIPIEVTPGTPGPAENEVRVSGGVPGCNEPTGPPCPEGAASTPLSVDAPALPFTVLGFQTALLDSEGSSYTQAAGHPDGDITALQFPSVTSTSSGINEPQPLPVQDLRQAVIELPPGIVGDALSTPTCTLSELQAVEKEPEGCPRSTQIGVLTLHKARTETTAQLPMYNIEPEKGYPAEFGVYLAALGRSALLYASVGPAPEYRVIITAAPAPRFEEVLGVSAILYGHPSAIDNSALTPVATFTNSSDCAARALTTVVHADSWQAPGRVLADGLPDLTDPNWKSATSAAPPATGCQNLQFNPSLTVQPTTTAPDSPAGLDAELTVPQNTDPEGLATPPLKDAIVTLPRGLVLSPSQATGLQACTPAQINLAETTLATCPGASRIGTVTVDTPLLKEPLTGQVYLGTPECNPCSNTDAQSGRLARLYIEAHSDRYGITLKIPGYANIDPTTGQITTVFHDTPQQPFEHLKLQFPQKERAILSTPSTCSPGGYTTTSDLVPWSTPYTPDATPSSTFQIACTANPFAPAFTAGTTNPQSGAYSPFTLTFSRNDGEQFANDIEQTLPPGLLAKLAGVTKCGDTEAAAGSCPASSRIGSVTVGAGPGTSPFYTTGAIYLTGPYNGGAFGEVVVVQAVAGPFNLGTVVVRGSIRIDPATAQASVVSDPFPSILDGIPLQLRTVNVTLDRPEFTFNATSCNAMAITGKLVSTQGTTVPVSSHYQATNCQGLPFKPVLTASTQGHTSKQNGASLRVKLTSAGLGQANLAKVDLTIPSILPSRLTTLQKACTEKQFNTNPAGCPAASDIATAVVHTPLLDAPLAGPVFFVSHGGAAFPDTEIVLQGENVTLILDGHTQITKGVTYSRFETIPDAPFTSFEFLAPEGPYSIFGANGNLCAPTKTVTLTRHITRRINGHKRNVTIKTSQTVTAPIQMPTTLVAQSGAIINQDTPVTVTGCTHPKAKAKKAGHRRSRRKRGK